MTFYCVDLFFRLSPPSSSFAPCFAPATTPTVINDKKLATAQPATMFSPSPPPPAVVRCCDAPSRNLNAAHPHFATAKEMHAHLREITRPVRAAYYTSSESRDSVRSLVMECLLFDGMQVRSDARRMDKIIAPRFIRPFSALLLLVVILALTLDAHFMCSPPPPPTIPNHNRAASSSCGISSA